MTSRCAAQGSTLVEIFAARNAARQAGQRFHVAMLQVFDYVYEWYSIWTKGMDPRRALSTSGLAFHVPARPAPP